jgi:hypothetical protein
MTAWRAWARDMKVEASAIQPQNSRRLSVCVPGYVGQDGIQDGILRPIGNRPSDELASARKRQVANLPFIAPESSSIG